MTSISSSAALARSESRMMVRIDHMKANMALNDSGINPPIALRVAAMV
jgi:hypothetical protein